MKKEMELQSKLWLFIETILFVDFLMELSDFMIFISRLKLGLSIYGTLGIKISLVKKKKKDTVN